MSGEKLYWADAIEKVMLDNNYFADLETLHKEAAKIYEVFNQGIEGVKPSATINGILSRAELRRFRSLGIN